MSGARPIINRIERTGRGELHRDYPASIPDAILVCPDPKRIIPESRPFEHYLCRSKSGEHGLVVNTPVSDGRKIMFQGILKLPGIVLNATGLVFLLSVVATIPILQFASFGYMLESAQRVARGYPWKRCFPGAAMAGRLLIATMCALLSWLPVWFVADLAYTGEIIQAGSNTALRLRIAARVLSALWVLWVLWAIFRGGRIKHFLWPAPMMAARCLFQGSFWREAEDRLWSCFASLHLGKLLWQGFFASLGAVLWLSLPATLILIGLSSKANQGAAALIGLVGATSMIWVLSILPFLQIHFCRVQKFSAFFHVSAIRSAYRKAPWSFCLATWTVCLFAVPLYVLRIEPPPSQLWWMLSLFFVALLFPAKLVCGWAMHRSEQRWLRSETSSDVFWVWRYAAWFPQLAIVVVYLGVLYLAKFATWEGAASILLQHAFLPPVPFFIR